MSAGLPFSIVRHRLYRQLKKLARRLNAAGFTCTYANLELVGDGWHIFYAAIYASNGEAAYLLQVVGDKALPVADFIHRGQHA